MAFNVTTTLLDALVLSVVSKEDTYGYKITQEVKEAIDISDSTLYPVLRRLQKDDCLNIYDVEHSGRNRRYYKITNKGKLQLALYREEWEIFKENRLCAKKETMMMNRFDEIPNSKDEFLQSLEMLLAPLSETERKDALSFYLEYFDEAGSENEMSVLNQLGSPKSVADKILSESGYVTEVDEEKNEGENDKKEETIKSNTPISNTKSSIKKTLHYSYLL